VGRFLRGGPQDDLMRFQEDAIQDHLHIDSGHTHTDTGHAHSYIDKYNTESGNRGDNANDRWSQTQRTTTTEIGHASLTTESSNIGLVTPDYRTADETRPKNFWVLYLMRVD
jgi:hypothetical protein